jgi:hypothetical protein
MRKSRKQQKNKTAEQMELFEKRERKSAERRADRISSSNRTEVELLSELEKQRTLTKEILEEVPWKGDEIARGVGESGKLEAIEMLDHIARRHDTTITYERNKIHATMGIEAFARAILEKETPWEIKIPRQRRKEVAMQTVDVLDYILNAHVDNGVLYWVAKAYAAIGLTHNARSLYEQVARDPSNRMQISAKNELNL